MDSSLARDGSRQALRAIIAERSGHDHAEWLSDCAPKNRPPVLAMCAAPGQLDHFALLLFQ